MPKKQITNRFINKVNGKAITILCVLFGIAIVAPLSVFCINSYLREVATRDSVAAFSAESRDLHVIYERLKQDYEPAIDSGFSSECTKEQYVLSRTWRCWAHMSMFLRNSPNDHLLDLKQRLSSMNFVEKESGGQPIKYSYERGKDCILEDAISINRTDFEKIYKIATVDADYPIEIISIACMGDFDTGTKPDVKID